MIPSLWFCDVCGSNDKIIRNGAVELPEMNGSVAADEQTFLAIGWKDARGEYRIAVIDENLNRAAVDKDAQMEQTFGQGTGALFALFGVETLFQPRAVDRDFLRVVIVADRQTAAAIRLSSSASRIRISSPPYEIMILEKIEGRLNCAEFSLCQVHHRTS